MGRFYRERRDGSRQEAAMYAFCLSEMTAMPLENLKEYSNVLGL
ncbi:MAG: hypothetical protein PUP93_13350 [Rhizonema sp. NSF051]|nr:hypothetical protein [Rhizonema sp. NSF051]